MTFGLDFGLKRIGLAKLIGDIIVPIPPIIRKNRQQASKELQKILQTNTPQSTKEKEIVLVIGLPLMDSIQDKRETQNVSLLKERVQHFLKLIHFSGKVVFIDEAHSSKEAEERLRDRSYKKRREARKNGHIDSISACIILERYRDSIRHHNHVSESNIQSDKQPKIQACAKSRVNKNPPQKESQNTKTTTDSTNLYSHKTNTIPQDYTSKSLDSKRRDLQKKIHIPVLLQEVLATFDYVLDSKKLFSLIHSHKDFKDYHTNVLPNFTLQETTFTNCIIDCTLGFGGMSEALLQHYPNLKVYGIDRDKEAIAYNAHLEHTFKGRFCMQWGDFASILPQVLTMTESCNQKSSVSDSAISHIFHDKKLCVRGILADIGVSSHQLDSTQRGFNFHAKELDMRMDTTQNLTASNILHTYSAYELERIFRDYGEISRYKKLANLIVNARQRSNITGEVLQNIALQISHKRGIHPATMIYQALRIEVNNELGQLAQLLESCSKIRNAIVCIISFHSLEDRMVKEAMRKWAKSCICPDSNLTCTCGNHHAKGIILYKKPLTASHTEITCNPRARSAKLRAFYFF